MRNLVLIVAFACFALAGCGNRRVDEQLLSLPPLFTVEEVNVVTKGDPTEVSGYVPTNITLDPSVVRASDGTNFVVRLNWKSTVPPFAKSELWTADWIVDGQGGFDRQEVGDTLGGAYVSPLLKGGTKYTFSLSINFSNDTSSGRQVMGTVTLRRITVDLNGL